MKGYHEICLLIGQTSQYFEVDFSNKLVASGGFHFFIDFILEWAVHIGLDYILPV